MLAARRRRNGLRPTFAGEPGVVHGYDEPRLIGADSSPAASKSQLASMIQLTIDHLEATVVGGRGPLYPSCVHELGLHCRLAGPGRPVGSNPGSPVLRAPVADCCPDRTAATEVRWEVAPRAPVQGSTSVAVVRTKAEVLTMTDEIRWFVGIDWASESHQI